MKIKKITFSKDGFPGKVTVELDITEAAWVASRAERVTHDPVGEEIGSALGDVFNRYWDNGVAEASALLLPGSDRPAPRGCADVE